MVFILVWIGLLLMVAVLNYLVTWAGHGMVSRRNLAEAQERAIFLNPPNPDKPMEYEDAVAYGKHIIERWGEDLPGRGNKAVTCYLSGKHDAAEMERLLDVRLGLIATRSSRLGYHGTPDDVL